MVLVKKFLMSIGSKIFLVGKLMQKVSFRRQVLSWKIRVENFSNILHFEDRFQIFNFREKIFCWKINVVIFQVGKLVRKIGLGEKVLSWKIVAKNLRSLKVNVRKLVSRKNSDLEYWWKNIWCSTKFKSESWYQKLSRKIGAVKKLIEGGKSV